MTLNKAETAHYANEKATSRLVTYCYAERCSRGRLTPEKVHALCKLTWLPSLQKNKLPALWSLWDRTDDFSVVESARELARMEFSPRLVQLASATTGFVNYYHAYRNSSIKWISRNFKVIAQIVRDASRLATDADAASMAQQIDDLPGVPKPTSRDGKGTAASILTPLVACLDPRHRFPIVNRANHVVALQRRLAVTSGTLVEQCAALTDLIGRFGMEDALMIDVASNRLSTLRQLQSTASFNSKVRESRKPMTKKDESGYEIPPRKEISEGTRLHNKMTNALTSMCKREGYIVLEGKDPYNFDMLLEDIRRAKKPLLIEAKSSIRRSDLRLAIGQLLDYKRGFASVSGLDMAILLPRKPSKDDLQLLDSVDIDALWFMEKGCTSIAGTRSI